MDELEYFYQNTYLPQMNEVNTTISGLKSQVTKLWEEIRLLKEGLHQCQIITKYGLLKK